MDREKVIKELEERIKVAEECMGNPMFTPDAIRTIIALLKKQEAQKFFVDESGKITPLPIVFPNCPLKEYEAVVRCKDCKYGKIHGINVECIAHEEVGYDPEPWHPLDWFCADGEKRTD